MDVLEAVTGAAAGAAVSLLFVGAVRLKRARALHTLLQQRIQMASTQRLGAADPDLEASRIALGKRQRSAETRRLEFLRVRLLAAGVSMEARTFLAMQGALAAVVAVLSFALAPAGVGGKLGVALLGGGAGFLLPLAFLSQRRQQRLAQLTKQLPQAIDSMASTLQVGSTLPQAMALIAREMPPPIAAEFSRVVREVDLGVPLTEALEHLYDRAPSADLLLLSSAVSIQQRVGGDLAGIFKGISHTVRERLRIQDEIQVLTAQGRYSTYIITALPLILFGFLWVHSREYVSQLFEPGSRGMVAFAVGGIVLGYVSMQRIVSVDV